MKEIYFTTDEICSLNDECDIKEIKQEIDRIINDFVEWGSNYNNDNVEILADKERYVLLWLMAEYGYSADIETNVYVFYSRCEMARWCFEKLDSREYFRPDPEPEQAKLDIEYRNNIIDLLFGSMENYDKYCKVA